MSGFRALSTGPIACALLLVGTVMAPSAALACGGTFCDGSGPVPMPVDQTGENILFIQDGPAIEAHIQIQYTGEPQRFAWVVPIPAVPTFRVGSDLLFRELLRSTVPSYTTQPMPGDTCNEDLAPWLLAAPLGLAVVPVVGVYFVAVLAFIALTTVPGCANQDLLAIPGSGETAAAATVVFRDSVGAFDITVLEAGTADAVMTWLADNQYTVPLTTRPILAQYANENSLFAAVKLVSSAQVDEIHPIVLRYEYGVPCVPLRLTAVAAASDMGVRTFFLGQARTVPNTYRHVEVNPARLDWLNNGANYMQVVSAAVDDPESGGQGFVTEYAGPSNVVTPINFFWWQSQGIPPVTSATGALALLESRGLMSCTGSFNPNTPFNITPVTPQDSCSFFHPLVRGLLQDHLPPPANTTEREYWTAPEAFGGAPAFNAAAFMEDFNTRIQRPAEDAASALSTRPYLTRLITTISPDEMTVDPEFHEAQGLPDVINTRQVATTTSHCDGFTTAALPDGRRVEIPAGGSWPAFDPAMPFAERVEDNPDPTTRITRVSRTAEVDKHLSAWNGQRRPTPSGLCACTQLSELPGLSGVMGLLLAGGAAFRRGRRRG